MPLPAPYAPSPIGGIPSDPPATGPNAKTVYEVATYPAVVFNTPAGGGVSCHGDRVVLTVADQPESPVLLGSRPTGPVSLDTAELAAIPNFAQVWSDLLNALEQKAG